MYEHLESLRSGRGTLLTGLTVKSESEARMIKRKLPACPDEYIQFLVERGTGPLIDNGEHFVFEDQLLSAAKEYYQDREILRRGAEGDVYIFGWESTGTAYGFDSGDNWRMVEIDENRTVTPLELSFKEFVEGLLVCYPQIPMKCTGNTWEDGVTRQYTA